jgi:chemotaxis protein methyltransferase WspC
VRAPRQLAQRHFRGAPLPEPARSPVLSQTSEEPLQLAARLADGGRLDEAAAVIERALAEFGPSAEAYYLLGVVRDAASDGKRAEECYRKALYLSPDHEESLLHLALVAERGGDLAGAQRYRERARRVAERTAQ